MKAQLQIHEIQEVTSLKKFFDYFKVDLVFDVGANVRQYATMLRTKVGFQGKIISYELYSKAYEELKKKTLLDPNWYTFNYALSDVSGMKTLNQVGSSQMNSLEEPAINETSILQSINTKTSKENVEVKHLDQAYEEVKALLEFRTPFLKLDTQGHDLTILEASNKLGHFSGIQTQISFKSLYKATPKYDKTIKFLENIGFELTAIFPNNAGHFPYLLEQDLIAFNKSFLP